MKKNYVVPEMEEVLIEAPVILEATIEPEKETAGDCDGNVCGTEDEG